MRSHEGNASDGARIDSLRRRPGSRRSRLAEASKQLAILMEEVDLDAEPELGRALTDAVIAVDRVSEHVRGPARGESIPRNVPVEAVDGHHEPSGAGDVRAGLRTERGGLRFAGESGTE